jgi:hypothetical protein
MKLANFLTNLIIFTGISVGIVNVAYAYQPQGLVSKVKAGDSEGIAKEIKGGFVIQNTSDYPIAVQFVPSRSNSYSFQIDNEKVILQPKERKSIGYSGGIFEDGKWQINLEMRILSESGELAGKHTQDLYFLVENGKYQVSSYEKLFLQVEERDGELGNSFKITKDDGQIPRFQDDRKYPEMEELEKMDRQSVERIPTESGGIGDGSKPGLILKRKFVLPRRPLLVIPRPKSEIKTKTLLAQGTAQAQGFFRWKGMDNQLHSAFGWRVIAWRQRGGSWTKVAEDWIQSSGSWRLNLPQEGGKVKFQYLAYNRFFTPQNSAGDTYRWVGPEHNGISPNHNEGDWFADTSGGAVRGLGEVYKEGMDLWSSLYWNGGISPLRKDSIKLVFPNTAYDCGSGNGVPWSCANRSGTIWLIPSHAGRNGVTQHELAHQVNFEYWGSNLPSDAGGSHTLGGCFTPGLAMTEGFANFMVFWAQADRNSTPSGNFDFNIENPNFACTTNNRNESWAAGAFWDLHDTHADGNDSIWFNNAGAVPGLYLRSGLRNSMADFHPIYRNSANAEHRGVVDNIFRQNHIIP